MKNLLVLNSEIETKKEQISSAEKAILNYQIKVFDTEHKLEAMKDHLLTLSFDNTKLSMSKKSLENEIIYVAENLDVKPIIESTKYFVDKLNEEESNIKNIFYKPYALGKTNSSFKKLEKIKFRELLQDININPNGFEQFDVFMLYNMKIRRTLDNLTVAKNEYKQKFYNPFKETATIIDNKTKSLLKIVNTYTNRGIKYE